MNKKNTMFCLILVFMLFCLPCLAQQQQQETESITITTYYPSPYGSYNELRAKKMGIGDTYYQGTVSIDPADLIVEGNVGIGTTGPFGPLQVKTATNRNFLVFDYANTMTIQSVNDAGSALSAMRFRASPFVFTDGNVGIGTTEPGAKLDVAGNLTVREDLNVKDSAGTLDSLLSGGIIKEKFLPYCKQEITSDVYTNGQSQTTGCKFAGYTGYYDISELSPENVRKDVEFGRGEVGTLETGYTEVRACYTSWCTDYCKIGTDCSDVFQISPHHKAQVEVTTNAGSTRVLCVRSSDDIPYPTNCYFR